MTNDLTLGERIAWYRRRRGISQDVLAGMVGRTTDWLSKVENSRIDLDRLSVIRSLAEAVDVSLGDLLAEPSLMSWTADSGHRTVPALRSTLTSYRHLAPSIGIPDRPPEPIHELRRQVHDVWDAYQSSRFGYVTHALPILLDDLHVAVAGSPPPDHDKALRLQALAYQAAAATLSKVGETDLSWIAADRGLAAAAAAGDDLMLGSMWRTVAHALLSNGRYEEAVDIVSRTGANLAQTVDHQDETNLSVYGTLFLTGAMAAARADDRAQVQTFLEEADRTAREVGHDANHLWTAFGPTNVAIHRVATAMELGDVQVAVDLGPLVDTTLMPTERRVRHALEVARAFNARNRQEDALTTILNVERFAPEQVKYHFISRLLVLNWIRRTRGKPSTQLADLARRLNLSA